jgi:hypothetical protein
VLNPTKTLAAFLRNGPRLSGCRPQNTTSINSWGTVLLEGWIRDRLKSDRELYGLPEDESLWPTTAALPTLRVTWGYLITRDALTEPRNSRKLHRGDFADWCHVQNAANVDEFVTEDKRFRDILTRCPGAKPKVFSTEAWIQTVISTNVALAALETTQQNARSLGGRTLCPRCGRTSLSAATAFGARDTVRRMGEVRCQRTSHDSGVSCLLLGKEQATSPA